MNSNQFSTNNSSNNSQLPIKFTSNLLNNSIKIFFISI